MTTNRVRLTSALRAGWGGALLFAPSTVLRIGGPGFAATPGAVAVARVLGARHLAQAAVTAFAPGASVVALGTATDVLHASGNVLAAAVLPRWRQAALVDAAVATAFAVAGWATRP